MFRELSDLVDNREQMLPLWGMDTDRLTALFSASNPRHVPRPDWLAGRLRGIAGGVH